MQARRWPQCVVLILSLPLLTWAVPPDTLRVAWPCTLTPARANLILNAEQLTTLSNGLLVVRYWGEPTILSSSQAPSLVLAWPTLPDSGYPKPDFTVPAPLASSTPDPTSPLLWLFLLGSLLAILLFHRLLLRGLQHLFYRLYWRLRWEVFLFRYVPRRTYSLQTYANALFELLLPYADFHPGSLVPSEVIHLQGPPPLTTILKALIPVLYQERYLEKPLSSAGWDTLLQTIHEALCQARPLVSRPDRHRLSVCLSG